VKEPVQIGHLTYANGSIYGMEVCGIDGQPFHKP
jgi:hypothetical protein